jgi:hypothetical protein
MVRKIAGIRLMSVAALFCAAATLSAAPITFANFTQVNLSATPWTFTNPLGAPADSNFSASTQVNFSFNNLLPGLSPLVIGNQLATATLSLTGPITPVANNFGGFLQQRGINGTLTFIRNSDLSNLLTVMFSDAALSGFNNANGAAFVASEASAIGTVTFSSDYLLFAGSSADDMSISLTALVPVLQIGDNGQIRSFAATGGGQFSSDPGPTGPVPEPASLAMLGSGLLALGIAVRRPKLS